ncbi:MAG: hypothetical protein K6U74_03210 [Firmicutes bacterium]|nr:hypothetical protein [Bacillota bacterium]
MKKKQVREVSPECRAEINRPRKISATYRQGRVVAPTAEEAFRQVEEKYPELTRVTLFPCPVQPWSGTIWWEWLGKVGPGEGIARGDTPVKLT